MSKFYVTYGFGSWQRGNFSIVEAPDYDEAQRIIYEAIGPAFAFCYDESEWSRNGSTQAEDFNLTEIPLQAQVME